MAFQVRWKKNRSERGTMVVDSRRQAEKIADQKRRDGYRVRITSTQKQPTAKTPKGFINNSGKLPPNAWKKLQ